MSIKPHIPNFLKFSKMDRLFYIYDKDLHRVINGDLYSKFREEIDEVFLKIKKGEVDEEMKDYVKPLNSLFNFLKSNKKSLPYVYIFKFLVMYKFGIITFDVDFESIDDLLKLDELSKMIIFPKEMLTGGNPTDELTVRGRRQRNKRPRFCLLITTGFLAAISYFSTGMTLESMDYAIGKNIDTFTKRYDSLTDRALSEVLPRGYERYIEYYPTENPDWKPDFDYTMISDFESPQLLLDGPQDALVVQGTAESLDETKPTAVDIPKYTPYQIETYETMREILATEYYPKMESFKEHVNSLKDMDIKNEDLFLLFTRGVVPSYVKEEFASIVRKTSQEFQLIFEAMASNLQNKIVKRVSESIETRKGTLATRQTEESSGIFGKIGNTMYNLWSGLVSSQQVTGEKIMGDAKTSLEITQNEFLKMIEDSKQAGQVYASGLKILFSDMSESLRQDYNHFSNNCYLSAFFIALTINLILIQVFGPKNRITRFVLVPLVTGIVNSSGALSLLHMVVQTGIISAAEATGLFESGVTGEDYIPEPQGRTGSRRTGSRRRRRGSVSMLEDESATTTGGKKNKTRRKKQMKISLKRKNSKKTHKKQFRKKMSLKRRNNKHTKKNKI